LKTNGTTVPLPLYNLILQGSFLWSGARREIKPFGSMAHPSQAKPNNIGALHSIIPCFNSSFLMKLA